MGRSPLKRRDQIVGIHSINDLKNGIPYASVIRVVFETLKFLIAFVNT